MMIEFFCASFFPPEQPVICVANRPTLRRLRAAVETGTVVLLWEASERPTCLKSETFATAFQHIDRNVHTRSVTAKNESWISSVCYPLPRWIWLVSWQVVTKFSGKIFFIFLLWTLRQHVPSKTCLTTYAATWGLGIKGHSLHLYYSCENFLLFLPLYFL
jgi:hypothetical protein